MAYIDREEFKRKLIDEKSFFPAIVARAIEEMPAVDVVKVVRCEKCIHGEDYNGRILCNKNAHIFNKNDFCSCGERKDT